MSHVMRCVVQCMLQLNEELTRKQKKICKKLKSGANGSFLSIIGYTAGDLAKYVTVGC